MKSQITCWLCGDAPDGRICLCHSRYGYCDLVCNSEMRKYVDELPDNAVITEIEIAGKKIQIEPPVVVQKGDKITCEDLACKPLDTVL